MTGMIVAVTLCGNAMGSLPLEHRPFLRTGETDLSSRCTAVYERQEKAATPFGAGAFGAEDNTQGAAVQDIAQ